MQIIFDTTDSQEHDAIGLVALLLAMYPKAAPKNIVTMSNDWTPEQLAAFTNGPTGKLQVLDVDDSTKRKSMERQTDIFNKAEATTDAMVASTLLPDTELDEAVAKIEQADNPAQGASTAAEVFDTPVRIMLPAAGATTYAQFIEAGWNDDLLVANGMMAAQMPKVTAPLPPSSGTPTAPPNTVPTPPPPPKDAASVFAAPSATPAPPPANVPDPAATTGGVQFDSDGLPWDARIHASTRTKTAKGAWTKLKKVEQATYDAVVAELRGAIAADKAAAHVPLNATPPPPPPASGPIDFTAVATYVGQRGFDAGTVQRICMEHGVPGLSILQVMPNKCAEVLAAFQVIPA